ncbi:oligosaccharide flippase family protein [Klebsiella aerogenes]|uniref:lipopolysaccharide biosynthesis protein n=1 Tax=Klebsiella aerogenes TaxID=548 RepID=UPI001BCFA6BE|nr:oligosaccharide flippase family protein [Klebsiella aerogenes]HBQ1805936.1 oligosaccharide flippase family protein [Klebsiella aerogenes]HBQ2427769.1 oligosaccharide flippase family protein [Klebsiella aerogenes]HCM5150077.1 oligosaccharide flippase family protein [Klebsiella aerogenes]HDT3080940.1 oligosaccharide flippase family protein [Klebsiella aerogenes]HDU4640155.1 oligosaccharide flippase family protein [Klebsiella aerogenes]
MKLKVILSFAIGPIGAAALGFITLPLMTWLYSPEDIGRFGMLNVAVSFSVLLFCLGMDQAYVRQYHESIDKGELLKISITPGFILLLIVSFFFIIKPNYLATLLFGVNLYTAGVLAILIIISSFILRFLSLILRMEGRGGGFSLSQLIPKIVTIICLSLLYFFWAQHDFEQLLWVSLFAFLSTLIVMMFLTRKDWVAAISAPFSAGKSKDMIFFGFPLILGSLSFWGVTAMDRVFLRTLSTFDQLAVFSVAVSFANAASIIQSIFSTLWAPMVYKISNNESESIELVNKASKYILLVVVALFCLAGLFSWVIDFFIPENYSNVKFILLACLGYPLLYTLSETTVVGIGISKKTSYSMFASVLALCINFGLNYAFVPLFGAAGAAVSTCVTFWFFLVFRTEFSILCWKTIPRFELYFFTFLCVAGASFEAIVGERYSVHLKLYWCGVLFVLIYRNRLLLTDLIKCRILG